jgi:hypothetical protein
MSNTKYLDLDAVSGKVDFTVKLGGVEHRVKESSIQDFIDNATMLEGLALQATVKEELEVTIKIIQRALPTASEADLRNLSFTQLDAIRNFVMTANGEKAEEEKVGGAPAEGNVPAAD